MKIKCGTDIIEIDRIKESIDSMQNKFIERIFTNREIEYCESKNAQKYQHYAARFAAKEAVFKAISERIKDKYSMGWKDIEILNNNEGRPVVNILIEHLEDVENIDLSISHCKKYATATAIAMFS